MADEFKIEEFDTKKNLVLQASAGTGKTYNICEIVDKLLSDGVSIDKLLIVTYTEKAAGELRNRIREKIGDKNIDIDSAAICTIHSFCQKTLDEFCVSAGKPSQMKLVDNSSARDFAMRYIRTGDIYKEICGIKHRIPNSEIENNLVNAIAALLEKYYLNADYKEEPTIVTLKKNIKGFNSAAEFDKFVRDYYIYNKSAYDACDGLADDIAILAAANKESMRELAGLLEGCEIVAFNGKCYRKSNDMLDSEKDAFDRINKLKKAFEGLTDIANLCKGLVIKHAADIYKKWTEEKERYHSQTYDDMIRAVREAVVAGGPLLDRLREKYSYAIIDEFQDTNQKQWDIFKTVFMCDDHNIIVVLDLKQSIYAFQGAQVNVCKKAIQEICDNGGIVKNLVKNYRATKDVIESTNDFFSIEGAIDGFEKSGCGNEKFKATYEDGPVKAFWVCDVPEELPEHIPEHVPEHIPDELADGGSNKAKPFEETYAEVICQTIIDCCSLDENDHSKLQISYEDADGNAKERNVTFSDFTILAKTRPEMKIFERALERSGIPFIKYKDEGLLADRECAHWIALLEAINVPDFAGRNRIKLRRALVTSFFNKSLTEIRDTKYDRDNTEEVFMFEKWRTLADERRWEELIEAIIEDTELEKKMSSLRDIKSLGTMKQVADYAINYLSGSGSLTLLIRNLKARLNAYGDEDAEDGDSIIAKSTDFDAVRMMTIHASKGLEFPIVISVAGLKGLRKYETMYEYHDEKGNYTLSFDKGDKGLHDREQVEECKRLIYVAYTRAKYILMLPGHYEAQNNIGFIMDTIGTYCSDKDRYRAVLDNGKGPDELKSEVCSILKRNKEISEKAAIAERGGSAIPATTIDWQRTVLKQLVRETPKLSSYKHAYSSMSHGKSEEDTMSDTGINVSNGEGAEKNLEPGLEKYDRSAKQIVCRYDNLEKALPQTEGYPAGAGIGNALHDVLELMDYTKDPYSSENEELIKTCFKDNGIARKPQWIDDTKCMIENVLNACLPEIRGSGACTGKEFCLKDIERADRKNEAEFNFNKEGENLRNYFNGFVDLIIKRGEYYSVLDWKSDRLNEEFSTYCAPQIIKEQVDKKYTIQRVLYSYMLIKWLGQYYPGLSEQEIFEQHFGGIYYVFLRGCRSGNGNGIYAQTWEDFASLKAAYEMIKKDKA